MLQSVLANLKNIKLQQLEALVPENLRTKATAAVTQAATTTEHEIQKVVQAAVEKIIEGRDDVTEEVKEELRAIVTEFHMTPRGVVEHLKDTGNFLLARVPRSLDDVKNLRTTVALGLMAEAQKRIAARRAAEVTGKGRSRHGNGNGNGHGHSAKTHHEPQADTSRHTTRAEHATSADEGTEAVTHGDDHPHIEKGGRRRPKARREDAQH